MLHPRCLNRHQFRTLSYKKIISWYSGLIKKQPPEAPYQHIIQIGDPTLRTVSEEIPINLIKSPEIKFLINQMRQVMKKYNCLGLAAPQIGTPFRLFIMEFTEKQLKDYSLEEQKFKEMSVIPFKVAINPEIRVTDFTKLTFSEYCESVRGFHADVPRFKGLKLSAYDFDGQKYEFEATGWSSRIIQHEIDHLDGKLYTDLMNRKTLTCSCWQVINERRGKVELPYGIY